MCILIYVKFIKKFKMGIKKFNLEMKREWKESPKEFTDWGIHSIIIVIVMIFLTILHKIFDSFLINFIRPNIVTKREWLHSNIFIIILG